MNSYDLRIDLAGLRRMLSTLEFAAQSSPELAGFLIRLPEAFHEAFTPECDAAARAGKLFVRFKPTDRLLELCPALGTCDRKVGAVIEDAAVSHFDFNPDLMFEEIECTRGELIPLT